ncbi:expressed unknown protein [Seminavis robusta]|uniref:Uncharacterized protein n=1 Tax=Seminavis robusta TaxID=568900 RepID=A0A9N8DIN9_9STRA|nr:expressed unknown protein [Seminavis robusta]|eukprot:Sro104_g052780.1 n/a (441) ;mRNA; f:44444-45766
MYSSESTLDNGERSPTSVSYDCPPRDPLEEKVIRHLTRSIPLELRRVESCSGKSVFSKNSKGSRGSKGSKASSSRRKRSGKLEKKISQIILMSSASEVSDSSYSTKECTNSACRSAQFILTDLFYEASKTMNDAALPQPPFANGTSWSQIAEPEESSEDTPTKLPDPQGVTLSDVLPPRHPDSLTTEHKDTVSSSQPSDVDQQTNGSSKSKRDQQPEDPFADLDILPAYSAHIDVIKEMENESQLSSHFGNGSNEEHGTSFTLKRDNTLNASSEGTGTLGFSLDADDSLLQYSSTNLTSAFSTADFGEPQFNTGQVAEDTPAVTQPQSNSKMAEMWTSFDASPFQDQAFTDDFGFDSFPPFDNDGVQRSPRKIVKPTGGFSTHNETDPAWDPSRMNVAASSPYSPASVFNFFSTDDDNDLGVPDSKSDTLWDSIADSYFQ